MKVSYKGYEIEVNREQSCGGDDLLYYSIFRESDGYECESGFQDTADTVPYMIKVFKERVDNELAEDDPWMEKAQSRQYESVENCICS